jgi:hypothetical protein
VCQVHPCPLLLWVPPASCGRMASPNPPHAWTPQCLLPMHVLDKKLPKCSTSHVIGWPSVPAAAASCHCWLAVPPWPLPAHGYLPPVDPRPAI